VLPFANLSGDPEQEYFADGMVEEIITAFSRIRWLFVIARNSSFAYKGQAVDVKHVGRELGVRYLLEGSVRKAGGRVRIAAQLIDATNGTHLWADRFDGSLEDVFHFQDKVAVGVAGVIEPTLEAAETRRSSQRPTADVTACKPERSGIHLKETASWERSTSSTKRSGAIQVTLRRLPWRECAIMRSSSAIGPTIPRCTGRMLYDWSGRRFSRVLTTLWC
jgi:TolB-like protein